ncbi:Neprosin [Dillenia turbinata]|uniref:Neprosin n=1 Tax=Dillenia turbinata TaxID=194707 RepID=A0AAN8Z0N4_9MAGN
MKPTSRPRGMRSENSQVKLDQVWQRTGQECPQGTIPLKRTTTSNFRKKYRYAVASVVDSTYYGAKAVINVWNPTIDPNGESISQLWVASRSGAGLNSIEAGWMVNPSKYQDTQTRLFQYWTSDGYQSTGCYDHDCPGFVQTRSDFTFGIPLKPVSTYNEQQYDVEIIIHLDKTSKNWWVTLQGIDIGYWPASLFTNLSDSASMVKWGREIKNELINGHHTGTQMGSGHFPSEGYAKASYFRHVSTVDQSSSFADASLSKMVTNASCYDLLFGPPNATYGSYFYYGGRGFSDKCP